MRKLRLLAAALSIFAVLNLISAQSVVLTPGNIDRLGEAVRMGKGGARDVAFSPGGLGLAIASNTGVYLYNTSDFEQAPRVIRTLYTPTALAYSDNGLTLAVSDSRGTVHLIDSLSGTERTILSGHTEYVTDVAFSADGELLATVGFDLLLNIWRVEDSALLLTINTPAAVTSVMFSPDGTRVVTGGTDSTAHVWDVETAAELLLLAGHTASVIDVAYTPDGSMIVTAGLDNSARLWSARTGVELHNFGAHLDWVQAIAISPNGARLATASQDTTLRLWDIATFAELAAYRGFGTGPLDMAFNADGSFVYQPNPNFLSA